MKVLGARIAMTSVRLRLLVLALAPLVVLMPLLLLVGMARWTADYDRLLIANVESDLRIAEQYLARIMVGTGDDLTAVAGSAEFAQALAQNGEDEAQFFQHKRAALELDFLYYLPKDDALEAGATWPVITAGLNGQARTEIDVFSGKDLEVFPGALHLRARIDLIETEAAVPTDRRVEDRGMVVHAAAPVDLPGHEGVLVGGILLNRNLDFIDTINALVYLNAVTGGDRQGTATLFLDDVRVSTNVRFFENVRALGTRVSAVVRGAVLDEGRTWLDRAFVVNDWYISGYLPITDSFGARVGMLYVGFLEAPFAAAKNAAVLWMLVAFAAVLVVSVPVFFWLARGIFSPLERMIQTMWRVGRGNLSARNGNVGFRDEIGKVAGHLDDLLDQIQERDRLLNQRVEERTKELSAANAKLEQTYRQLVLSEKLASIGEITAGVAHEINNPVAVIQGNVDVIRETLGAEAAPLKTELDLIDGQITRIASIVGKLLQFARPGEFSSFDGSMDLAPLVRDCLLLVDHVLSKSDIDVVMDFAEVPPVRIDPGEMQQVVVNLLVNAVQAMGTEGQLHLRLVEEDREGVAGVALTVTDSGQGLSDQAMAHLFDPFFTTRLGEGTGLGLSISQTLIQRAEGLITARNAPEGGAVFEVWLPTA